MQRLMHVTVSVSVQGCRITSSEWGRYRESCGGPLCTRLVRDSSDDGLPLFVFFRTSEQPVNLPLPMISLPTVLVRCMCPVSVRVFCTDFCSVFVFVYACFLSICRSSSRDVRESVRAVLIVLGTNRLWPREAVVA